jgi:DNA repair protein RadC
MTPQQFARNYPRLAEAVAAEFVEPVAAEAFANDRDVRRFFRRVGVLPGGRRGARASETVLEVIDAVSNQAGDDEGRTRGVLAAYCRTDGELASGVCTREPHCDRCPLAGDCAYFSRRPTIKQLPESERPRERLLQLGEQQLTDAELLAIILGGGTPNLTAVELARNVLTRLGGFRELIERSPEQLGRVHGIGPAKSAAIKATLEIARRFSSGPPPERGAPLLTAAAVYEHYGPRLAGERRETFLALLLDIKNRLIRDVTISLGSLNQSIVHPREVFEPAIRSSAASVIFVHNHPSSGDPTPSRQDIEITRRLKQTGELIGIHVLDHVIVAAGGYRSFADDGLL